MKNTGIHLRLVFAAVLLIGATTLILGAIGVKTIHQFVRTRFEERIQFLAKYLALNAELGILIDERATLERLSSNLLEEQDVVRVMIINDSGEILTDVSKSKLPHAQTVEVPVELKTTNYDSLAFPGDKPPHASTQTIGSVRVMYATEGIDRLLTTMIGRLLWFAVGLTFLAILIFYFLSRSLVAPLTKIANAARNYAIGDLTERPVPGNLPETRELTIAFNSMLDSIEWSSKALENAYQEMVQQKTLAELGKFSMVVAHEVKNPLGIIKSSLSILKKDLGYEPGGNTMINYMEEEIQRLNRLIEDFLMFSRPISPTFRMIEVNDMMQSSVMKYQIQAYSMDLGIEFQISDNPCHVNGDPDLLIRAIDNLVKNAFEVSGKNSGIILKTDQDDHQWIVVVEDYGTGIDPELMEKIFEPFFTTRSKGTGLGLAFVSQVVAAHGGRVYAENKAGGGAKFIIQLPFHHSAM